MDYQYIEHKVEQSIGFLTLNRPEKHNALNRAMVDEIVHCAEAFDRDSGVRCIFLSANGRSFSAGADIAEMLHDNPIDLELRNQFAQWDRLEAVKKPMIGAVKGFVFGGGFELALCCDILMAASGTEFAFPEVNLGVMPGAGGTQRLTKLVGKNKALEWLWTGERISVETAHRYGIVNRIISPELLEEESLRWLTALTEKPPLSLRFIKDAVQKGADAPLMEGMQHERKNFYLLFSSEDQKEGMNAFLEKRKAHFKGK
ncbi:enoyl-CoA hydratase/isomerase family protein [Bacillus testis]|uniref:enoyl-CoA hydratase/isomerase family protein n=1 Tax=Bacillus testis TaxID=1622072 RepID=UPI00067E9F62|nr:enoyl-CoA hydratase-related protein [Bacillus testis]